MDLNIGCFIVIWRQWLWYMQRLLFSCEIVVSKQIPKIKKNKHCDGMSELAVEGTQRHPF